MRLWNLLKGEFLFLTKYGIGFLYLIFTVVYLCLLAAIPQSVRGITATILIFTDPAAMGLFFMGAVVLFEKSQRVESSLGVSPIKLEEYILGKLLSMMIVGVAVGLILGIFAGMGHIFLMIIGVAFSSFLFSMCGLFIASHSNTLNGFMIATVPFEVILCAPAILYLFGMLESPLWILHPGIAAIRLMEGGSAYWLLSIVSLVLWMIPLFLVCRRAVARSFQTMGGAKL